MSKHTKYLGYFWLTRKQKKNIIYADKIQKNTRLITQYYTKADRILVWNNRIYVPRIPDGHEKAIVDLIELELEH